jgi:hypothetical protein
MLMRTSLAVLVSEVKGLNKYGDLTVEQQKRQTKPARREANACTMGSKNQWPWAISNSSSEAYSACFVFGTSL